MNCVNVKSSSPKDGRQVAESTETSIRFRWHTRGRMAFRLLNEGNVDEALQLTTDALAGIEAIRGPDHMDVASARYFHARMLLSAGDTDAAF